MENLRKEYKKIKIEEKKIENLVNVQRHWK